MAAAKKKFKANGNKPNGWKRRNSLRANNRAFALRLKVKTRQFRRERTRQQPGWPQGLHIKNNPDCRCGSCSRGFIKGVEK